MISLADLRARNITPVWQEAVAVVQELIHTVRATTGSAELLPDLEHIALIPNGDVVAIPGSPEPDVPVRHAAVMLKLLLENTPVPPELDAFVERNIAEPPQYDSVSEFSRNLAFFERPGRRSDIERLVGRAMAAEQTRRADEELRRLKERASEVENTATSPTILDTPQRLRTVPVPLAVAVVFVLVVGLAWWWTSRSADPGTATPDVATEGTEVPQVADAATDTSGEGEASGQQSADPAGEVPAMTPDAAPAAAAAPAQEPSILKRTTDVVRTAVGSLFSSGADAAPAAAPPPVPEAPAAASRPASTRSARPSPARASSAPAPAAAGSDTAATPAPAPAVPAEDSPVAAAGEVAGEIADASEANDVLAPAVEEAMIFTALDEEVLPPVLVRPVLPKEPPPNVPADQVGTIEVVVDEQGDVISVRLISPANRYHERMLVSAAKMWKFRPAYKDGRPVRYRTRVRLTI